MKVPELKKLLGERSLTQSGNKADLIARLQAHDKESAGAKPSGGTRRTLEFPLSDHIVNSRIRRTT